MRALVFRQCGLQHGGCLLLVFILPIRVVLRFSSLHKNEYFLSPIRSRNSGRRATVEMLCKFFFFFFFLILLLLLLLLLLSLLYKRYTSTLRARNCVIIFLVFCGNSGIFCSQINKPGHGFKLHCLVSMATPLQGSPPFAGAGFAQIRLRF